MAGGYPGFYFIHHTHRLAVTLGSYGHQ
jgi:hypothetical protein